MKIKVKEKTVKLDRTDISLIIVALETREMKVLNESNEYLAKGDDENYALYDMLYDTYHNLINRLERGLENND